MHLEFFKSSFFPFYTPGLGGCPTVAISNKKITLIFLCTDASTPFLIFGHPHNAPSMHSPQHHKANSKASRIKLCFLLVLCLPWFLCSPECFDLIYSSDSTNFYALPHVLCINHLPYRIGMTPLYPLV